MIDLYGTLSVSLMAIFYMLEKRNRHYIFLFAVACLMSSGYAILIESWPFAVVEFLWSGVAFLRWHHGRDVKAKINT